MKKIITIEVEVCDETENNIIEHELKKFCEFQFWKGNEAKITIQ